MTKQRPKSRSQPEISNTTKVAQGIPSGRLTAMELNPDVKQKVQVALVLAMAVAAVRTGYVVYQRYAWNRPEAKPPTAPLLNPDYYVTPKKLHPYDLKSARQLTEQPV